MPRTNPHTLLAALAKLEHLRDPNAVSGKRQFRRFVIRGDAELHGMGDDRLDRSVIRIRMRDVGWGGVGFVCQEALEANSMYRLCFLNHNYVIGSQTALIRHCREVQDGLYLVGAQFCIEAGLLTLLGVDPAHVRQGGLNDGKPESIFQAPNEVA